MSVTCFAGFKSLGLNTFGYEVDRRKVSSILKLEGDLIEPEIKDYLSNVKNLDRIVLSDLQKIKENSNVCAIICVGTPSDDNGGADLTFVKKAIKQIIYISNTSLDVIKVLYHGTVSKKLTPYLKN